MIAINVKNCFFALFLLLCSFLYTVRDVVITLNSFLINALVEPRNSILFE